MRPWRGPDSLPAPPYLWRRYEQGKHVPAGLSWRWETASLPAAERGQAWLDTLHRVYGPGCVPDPLPRQYDAAMHVRRLDKLRVADVVCDPFGGHAETGGVEEAGRSFTVHLVAFGEKALSGGGETLSARQGDVLINLGAQNGDFEIRERTRVTAVSLPLSRLKAWMPSAARRTRYRLPAATADAQLLTTNFKSMSDAFLTGALNNGEALTEALVGLVAAVLSDPDEAVTAGRSKLSEIKGYIAASLDDPELSPGRIAAAHRISVRYLHALFETEAMTVQQYVIRERLLRSHRDLNNPCMRDLTITEVAYGCGFQSLNHFSRRFKAAFGVSPRQLRGEAGSRPPHRKGDPTL